MLSENELERYQRQILLIGEDGQNILKNKSVLQVGAGGLGCPLALYLVAAGIGKLVIFENDKISLSNLGRQILYSTNEIGLSKIQILKKKLNQLNPNVEIIIEEKWFSQENSINYLKESKIDYIVDASDNFETKFLVNDIGIKYNIPFTIAGIQGFEGQLISVIPHESTCYRCIFGDIPNYPNKGPIPVINSTCGVVGSLLANEVLKSILNRGKRILNQLLIVELENGDFSKIPIKINPKCKCQLN